MTDTLPEPPELDPAGLAGTNFSRARRGFEPAEVHAALGRAADALRAWRLRDAHLSERIDDLEERLVDAQRLDEAHLTAVLGEETARIITAARDAATEIREHAEADATRLLRETSEEAHSAAEAMKGEAEALRDEAARARDEAVAEATRVRSEAEASAATADAEARARHEALLAEAEGVLAERTGEAEQVAAGITEAANARLEAAREESERLRAQLAEQSDSILAAAREDGRAMVAEAKAVRERILRDLVERRGTARRQIEGARAGRDRIIDVLRSTIDEVNATIDGLGDADGAASAAAAEAASTVVVDAEAEVAQLLVDLGDDPTDVLTSPAPSTTAYLGSPEVPEVEVVADSDGSEGAADEEPDPAVAPAANPSDNEALSRSESESVQDAQAEDDRPGATVHDLFARIRAEGLTDDADAEAGDTDDADDAGDTDDETDGDETDGDETDGDETDGDETDGDEADGDEAAAPAADVEEEAPAAAARPREDDDTEEEPLAVAVGADNIDLTGPTASESGAAPVASGRSGGTSGGSTDRVAAAVATLATPTELLDRRDALLAPVEKSMSRVLRRLASDEQNEVLDRLRRVKRGRPDLETMLASDPEIAVARFVAALAPDFAKAADAGSAFWAEISGNSAGSLFGDDELLGGRLGADVTEFLDLHRAHLERTFADAESEGLDASDLADRVRAAYRDWRSGSLADLAGDLATAGFAHGERRAAGPGTPWRWVVDNGGLPCADGEDNALAGAVPCEEPFPTGDITPPAHPGCRCILAPVHH